MDFQRVLDAATRKARATLDALALRLLLLIEKEPNTERIGREADLPPDSTITGVPQGTRPASRKIA